MTDIPHFAFPFRFEGQPGSLLDSPRAAAVVEQDSKDEIVACATAIILCPLGFRIELPEFGIPDPTFSEGAADVDAIEAALAQWEPRAQSLVAVEPGALDVFLSNVTVRVSAPSLD